MPGSTSEDRLSSNVWITARAERSVRSRHNAAQRWLLAVPCAALLFSACAKAQLVRTDPKPMGGVEVLNAELAQHIEAIAGKSPTFRASWQMLQTSGVPVRIGTNVQLKEELPSWYRKNPRRWAAVTFAQGPRGGLSHVIVALNTGAMDVIAERAAAGDAYMKDELDRVLVHEIYGHTVPLVEARDASKGCPDALQPGESKSCVAVRETQIAAELEISPPRLRGEGDLN